MRKFVVATVSLVLAVPISAASASAATSVLRPAGTGYLTSSSGTKSMTLNLKVPKIACTKTSPVRTVRLGMFTHLRSMAKGHEIYPLSIVVEASCIQGQANAVVQVHEKGKQNYPTRIGAQVYITLHHDGVIDIDTNGTGGETAGPVHGPVIGDVLFGARIIGRAPAKLNVRLTNPKVDGKALAAVAHTRVQGSELHAGSLTAKGFTITR